MSIPQEKMVEFLQQRHLFTGMSVEAITAIAAQMDQLTLAPNQLLFAQGDREYTFYIIYSGKVRIWRKDGDKETILGVMETGDKFGEEAPLFNRPRSASVTALDETTLLTMPQDVFMQMLNQHPETKLYLRAIAHSYKQARKMKFDWIHPEEVIHLIARRHMAQAWADAIKPGLLIVFLLFIMLIAGLMPLPGFVMIIRGICLGLAAIGSLWLVWEIIDWRNDYFIITDQRVIWLEQVLLQSASRQEAPMSAIQSVNVTTSQLGRIFNYGDVFVRTFTGTGSLNLSFVDKPHRFSGIIEETLVRVRKKREHAEKASMRQSIRNMLGFGVAEPIEHPRPPEPFEPSTRRITFFRTREVEGDTITYHKHWWVFFRKIPIPFFGSLGLTGLLIYLLFLGPQLFSPAALCSSAFLVEFIFMVWMFYHYMDWRNDLYRLTKDTIIDSEKKPFGNEVTKSAPIKNIQSIEHVREGILRLILNFGTVKVNVAEAVLTFVDVTQPAIVQQDIYYRQERIKWEAEQAEVKSEQQRMAEWMKAYYDVWESEQEHRRRLAEGEEEASED